MVRVVGRDDPLAPALETADFVTVHTPLTDETRGLIAEGELQAMKPTAYLINTARGPIVDSAALERALREGWIAGAALDVTDPEPLPDGHPLWDLPNCLITPHTANTHEMARPVLSACITDNVRRYARGEPLVGPVDPRAGY